jgi:hypothetical protein
VPSHFVQHAVTICAHSAEVLNAGLLHTLQLGKRDYVVSLREPCSQHTIHFIELKGAYMAPEAIHSLALRGGPRLAFDAHVKRNFSPSFCARYRGEIIIQSLRLQSSTTSLMNCAARGASKTNRSLLA